MMSGNRPGLSSTSAARNAPGAFGASSGGNTIHPIHGSVTGKHHSSSHQHLLNRAQGVRRLAGSFGLKHGSGFSGGVVNKFGLPPPPDEDDDLLSHYASPKHNWDPLPLEFFPRPDAEQERQDAARFPCFKYYDLKKYTLQEARQLSAMDIIPKDSLKSVSDQPARTKRLKRTTAESSGMAGYYRYKNEGVEVIYGAKSSSSSSLSQNTRTLKRVPSGYEPNHGVGLEKVTTGTVVFRSQVAPPRVDVESNYGSSKAASNAGYASDRSGASQSAKEKSPSSSASPQPKKQGNRLDWVGLPGLKQACTHGLTEFFDLEVGSLAAFPVVPLSDKYARLRGFCGYTTRKVDSTVSSAKSMERVSISGQFNADELNEPSTSRGSTSSSVSNVISSSTKRAAQPPVRAASTETKLARVNAQSKLNVGKRRAAAAPAPKIKPKDVTPVEEEAGTSADGVLDTSSSMDEERLAAEALGVMAHEELGASDDEDMLAYF